MSAKTAMHKTKDEMTAALGGGIVGFCTGAFMTAAYGGGYVLMNWLGGSQDLQIIGGVATAVVTGLPLTAIGFIGGMAGVMTSRLAESNGSGKSITLGGLGGFAAGIYAMSLFGGLITADNHKSDTALLEESPKTVMTTATTSPRTIKPAFI